MREGRRREGPLVGLSLALAAAGTSSLPQLSSSPSPSPPLSSHSGHARIARIARVIRAPALPPPPRAPTAPRTAVVAAAYREPDGTHVWGEAARGLLASAANITLTFPVHKIVLRQQVHGHVLHKVLSLLRVEGLGLLYRGILPPLLQQGMSKALMFGAYDKSLMYAKAILGTQDRIGKGQHDTTAVCLAAVVSGTAEVAFMPFERVQTLLQLPEYHGHFRNTGHAFRLLYLEYGLREFYRGFSAILLRNGPSNALFFGLRHHVMDWRPEECGALELSAYNFAFGALLGATCSTIFYPLNVIKSNMMKRCGGDFISIADAFRACLDQRGSIRGLYRGVQINFTRSLLSWGIINTVYEMTQDWV